MGGAPEPGGPPGAAIQRGPCPKVPAEFDRRPLAGARGRVWDLENSRHSWSSRTYSRRCKAQVVSTAVQTDSQHAMSPSNRAL